MSGKELPQGWAHARISEISLPGLQRKPLDDEEFTYIDIGSIDRELKKISTPEKIIGKNAPSRARKIINKGDVLVSLTRPNLNAVALVSEQFENQIASTGFEVIKPYKADSRYIFSLTRSKDFIEVISGVVRGALYPAAKSADVQNYEIPLPPPSEQKIIADRLDTLLAQVEATKARLERIPEILKQFRQSVLAAAVSGRLTEDWRNNNSIPRFTNVAWEKILRDEPGSFKRGPFGSTLRKSMFVDKGYKVYEQYCPINDDCSYVRYYISAEKFEEMKDFEVKGGDFLIGCSGSLGRITQVPKDSEPGIINQALLRVRINEDIYSNGFFKYVFRSPLFQNNIIENSTGSAIPNMKGVKALKQMLIPLPHMLEQTEIVRRVEQLFAFADKMEAQVNAAQEKVSQLTQSILAKAFRGELTAQWREEHPELISGENSAQALLERIAAERQTLQSASRGTKEKRGTSKAGKITRRKKAEGATAD